MKAKIYSSDIIMVLFFHISFITLPYLQSYNLMKYGIIAVTAVFLLSKFKLMLRKECMYVNIVLLIFLTVILLTSFINRNNVVSRDTLFAAIVYSAIILEGFLLFQYIGYKNRLRKSIKIIYRLTLFYVILTDVLLLIKPDLFIQNGGYYFIGSKFSVAYTHFLLVVLYWRKSITNNLKITLTNKIILFMMFFCTIIISACMGSATGIVGSVFLFLFMILSEKLLAIASKPLTPVITLIFSCSFLFLFDRLLNSSFIKFIIEDVLGRTVTLTGRMRIYDNIFAILPSRFWTGYGHGSTYEVCTELLGAPNTQNGLLEILVQYGILGAVFAILLIYIVFKQNEKLKNTIDIAPFVVLIYLFIVLASIEITLGLRFWATLSIIISLQIQQINTCNN